MQPPVKVRPLKQDDINFIYATWLRHLWYSPSNTTTFSKNSFMRLHHARIERVLKEEPVMVACLSEDEEVIVGYRVGKFSYFKKPWRGLGFEKLLGGHDE